MFLFAGMVLGAILGKLWMGWFWNKGTKEEALDRILRRLRGV